MVVRQFTTLKGAAPLEHLVRVQSMLASHFGNAGSGLHRQLHNLTLLRYASPAANTANLAQTRLHHDAIFNRDQDQAPEGEGVRLPTCCQNLSTPSGNLWIFETQDHRSIYGARLVTRFLMMWPVSCPLCWCAVARSQFHLPPN
jgi:hypothetical protein